MLKQAFLLFVALSLAGCTHEIPSDVFEAQILKLYVYSKDGGRVTCSLERSSLQYNQLQSWIKQNKEGWKKNPATYIPGKVISAGDFSLNFLNSIAIFNHSDGQYVRAVTPEEHSFLSCN